MLNKTYFFYQRIVKCGANEFFPFCILVIFQFGTMYKKNKKNKKIKLDILLFGGIFINEHKTF